MRCQYKYLTTESNLQHTGKWHDRGQEKEEVTGWRRSRLQRSNLFISDFLPVNGSEILHLGVPEDHHDDDGFTLLDADPFS